MDWSFEVLKNHLPVETVIMWHDSVPSILVVYRFEVFCGILPKLTPNKTGMFLYFEFWLLYFFFNFEIVLQFFHICFSHHKFLFLSKRKTVGETWLTFPFYFYQAIWPLVPVVNHSLWSNICRFHWEEGLFPWFGNTFPAYDPYRRLVFFYIPPSNVLHEC